MSGGVAWLRGRWAIRVVARAAGLREGTVSAGVAELEPGAAPLGRRAGQVELFRPPTGVESGRDTTVRATPLVGGVWEEIRSTCTGTHWPGTDVAMDRTWTDCHKTASATTGQTPDS